MNLIVEKIRKNDAFKNASRRIAANIAKLPELLKRRSPSMRLFQMHHLTGLS